MRPAPNFLNRELVKHVTLGVKRCEYEEILIASPPLPVHLFNNYFDILPFCSLMLIFQGRRTLTVRRYFSVH